MIIYVWLVRNWEKKEKNIDNNINFYFIEKKIRKKGKMIFRNKISNIIFNFNNFDASNFPVLLTDSGLWRVVIFFFYSFRPLDGM